MWICSFYFLYLQTWIAKIILFIYISLKALFQDKDYIFENCTWTNFCYISIWLAFKLSTRVDKGPFQEVTQPCKNKKTCPPDILQWLGRLLYFTTVSFCCLFHKVALSWTCHHLLRSQLICRHCGKICPGTIFRILLLHLYIRVCVSDYHLSKFPTNSWLQKPSKM